MKQNTISTNYLNQDLTNNIMNTEEEINQLKLEINKLKSNLRDLTIKFKELKSQFPTSTDNGVSIPKAANVSNNDITTNVITNNTNNSNQIDQSQKIPNIQRYRGSVTPYKQDITDDQLYALAEAL